MLTLDPAERDQIPNEIVEVVLALAERGFRDMQNDLELINLGRKTQILQGTGMNAGKLTYDGVVVGIVRAKPDSR